MALAEFFESHNEQPSENKLMLVQAAPRFRNAHACARPPARTHAKATVAAQCGLLGGRRDFFLQPASSFASLLHQGRMNS